MKKGMFIELLLIVQILMGIVATLLLLIIDKPTEYGNIYILSLFYTTCLIVSFRNYKFKIKNVGIGMYILNIIMFIRYIISPVSVALLESYYDGFGPNPNKLEMDFALILMIYEMLMVFIIFRIKYNKPLINIENKKVEFLQNRKFIVIITIIGFIYLLPYLSQLIPENLFFLSENYQKNTNISGTVSIIQKCVFMTVFLLLLKWLNNIYNIYNVKSIPYISAIVVIIYMGLNIGTSRWNVIIPGIIGLYAIRTLYPKKFKYICIIVVIVGSISILSISLYKFSWAINEPKDILAVLGSQFQDYFSGPKQVAQGINASNIYNDSISLRTLFNDIFGTLPVLSNSIDQSNRLNVYFNLYNRIYNNSLIMPMISSGFAYFGIILSPIFSIICTVISMDISYTIRKLNVLEIKMIYIMIIFWLSLFMGFNLQIIVGNIVIIVLANLIVIKANYRIGELLKRRSSQ